MFRLSDNLGKYVGLMRSNVVSQESILLSASNLCDLEVCVDAGLPRLRSNPRASDGRIASALANAMADRHNDDVCDALEGGE